MGKVIKSAQDDFTVLARAIDRLNRDINNLRWRRTSVSVISGSGAPFTLGDDDGSAWIDRDDHSFHYVVNGTEYKFQGTQV